MVMVRKRLNVRSESSRAMQCVQCIHGLVPIVKYIMRVIPAVTLEAMSSEQQADCVFEIFELVAARTKLLKKSEAVLTSETEWQLVAQGLSQVFAGRDTVAPGEDRVVEVETHCSWWRKRYALSAFVSLLSGIWIY